MDVHVRTKGNIWKQGNFGAVMIGEPPLVLYQTNRKSFLD